MSNHSQKEYDAGERSIMGRDSDNLFIRKLDKRLCEEYDYWINERLGTPDYVPVGDPLNKEDPIRATGPKVELDIKDVKDE